MTHPGGTLEITTAKICPVDCTRVCPQKPVFRGAYERTSLKLFGGKPDHFLSLENFQTAIETVPTSVRINFSGFVEPLINPKAIEMIEYAVAKGHVVDLSSTFFGPTPDGVRRLAKAGIHRTILHLPDDQQRAHLPPTDTYLKTLHTVLTTPGLHITGYSRMDEKFISNMRAGNCEGDKPKRVRGPFHCGRLTPAGFVLLPNGGVALCCMDWNLDHPIGRLFGEGATTWDGLLNSPERLRLVKDSHAIFGATDTLCRNCVYPISIASLRPSHDNLPIFIAGLKKLDLKTTGRSW